MEQKPGFVYTVFILQQHKGHIMSEFDYTMAQAKRDFGRGLIAGARLESSILVYGWNLVLRSGGHEGYLIDARKGLPRFFATADAAIRALREIGFAVEFLTPSSPRD